MPQEKPCPKCPYGTLAAIGTKQVGEKQYTILGCDECSHQEFAKNHTYAPAIH